MTKTIEKNDLNNSKLFDLIAHLDKKEFAELGKWLRSPFHNTSEKAIKLYEGIKTKHRNTGRPVNELLLLKYIGLISSVQQKNIAPQHQKELKDVMHKLTLQIQDYLVWKKMKRDSLFERHQLMEVFLERGIHQHILPLITKSQRELEATSLRDKKHCNYAFKLEEMRFYVDVILNSMDIKKTKSSVNQVIYSFRQYSLSNFLRYYCAALNLEIIFDIQQEYPLRKAIEEHLEQHTDNEQPSVGTYYRMFKLLLDKTEENYHEFKSFFFNHLEAFELGEIRQFFSYGINYCTQMIKQGNKAFIEEKHLLYEKGLELACWSQNGYFSQHHFIQIVQNALLFNKAKWGNNFIEQYTELLKKEIKKIVTGYCNALVYHHDKQYEKAIQHLPTEELPPDFSYYLYIKILKVKIHYDSGNWGFLPDGGYAILNELENIRQYVNRPSRAIAKNIREQYINFTNIFKRIFNRKRRLIYPDDTSPLTQANLQTLQNDLAELKPLIERKWLSEKITELIQEIS